MIRGIGIDIVEVKRIRKLCERYGDRFLKRVYTSQELSYCLGKASRYECLSGRFAAKEAVVKATGGRINSYRDISILHGDLGPFVKIREKNFRILISITHIKDFAIAMAIWEE